MLNKTVIANIDKQKLLEEISDMFFNKNFGTKSKSEIELMLFKLYLESAQDIAEDDNNAVSDYKLGRELGISPTRVRNLRTKVDFQLKDYEWKKELEKVLINQQNISKKDDKIQITIRSRSLFYAIEDWVEDNGQTLEITLNPKQLIISKDYFYKLLTHIGTIDDIQNREIIKRINLKYKVKDNIENVIECGAKILDIGGSVIDIVNDISGKKLLSDTSVKILRNIFSLFEKL